MIRNAPPKHPDSAKWYWLEWPADELQKATITASTWTAPEGLDIDTDSKNGYRVGVRLSGGVDGEDYIVTNQINTSNSEILHEQITIRIAETGH